MKSTLVIWVCIFVGATAWGSIDQGLVAYYPFNSNANDETGNGWDGTVQGATPATDRFGNTNAAYAFDGANDYINIGNCLGTTATAFSVSLWMKSSELAPTDPYEVYISKKPMGVWDTGHWQLDSSPGTVNFACNDRYGGPLYERAVTVNESIHDDLWHMLTAVVGAQGSELYIDGLLVGTNSSVTIPAQDNAPIWIGALPDPFYRRWMTGLMDDVHIYNRALTASEIMELYTYVQEIPFAGFYPSVTHVHFGGKDKDDHLFFAGSFLLDEQGDGMDLARDDVTLEAGPLNIEIPAGSFQSYRHLYIWNGMLNDARIKAVFMQHREGCYSFLIQAHGVDLTGWTNPEEWKLGIGNDIGETTEWLKGHLYSDCE